MLLDVPSLHPFEGLDVVTYIPIHLRVTRPHTPGMSVPWRLEVDLAPPEYQFVRRAKPATMSCRHSSRRGWRYARDELSNIAKCGCARRAVGHRCSATPFRSVLDQLAGLNNWACACRHEFPIWEVECTQNSALGSTGRGPGNGAPVELASIRIQLNLKVTVALPPTSLLKVKS